VALPGLRRPALRSLALVALVALSLGAEGCARKKIYGESSPAVTAAVGEQLVIQLASNPASGYTWMPAGHPDPLVITLMASDFEPDSAVAAGTGGYHRWTFRAVGRGSTTVRFHYGRTWEQAPPERTATFTILVR
jgi:inhibitor of cysteine peptidase